jgi:hypothetical protein
MSSPSTFLNPMLGRVPGVISLAMLFNFLRCLPRPFVGGPVAYGRQMIQDALAAVDAIDPRDRLEAVLALRIPLLEAEADATYALARLESDWEQKARKQRHAMALERRAEAVRREIRRHRRALAAEDVQHVSPPPLAYDLDALEAVWRDLQSALPETALVELPMEVPAGFGMGGVKDVGPDGVLEARDEFEAEPLRRFKGVPKWKKAGRKYLDELTDEERDELIAAQLRGETIEEPPQRVEEYIEP